MKIELTRCHQAHASLLALAIYTALNATPSHAAILFEETFDSVADITCDGNDDPDDFFPTNWLRRNVDNRTSAAAVSYVNNAWILRGDFANTATDCAAFSTSWYSPAGAADDWMWTPAINIPAGSSSTTLSWNAITYDASYRDGYEVRVMPGSSGPPTGGAGAIGNQITGSTQVFAIAQENTTWTARTASLNAYAGQSVYIGFRNNSNNQFLLLIDDIKVQSDTLDVAADAPLAPSIYTKIPASLGLSPNVGLNAKNVGNVVANNVSANAQWVRDGNTTLNSIGSDVLANVAIGAIAPLSFPVNLPTVTGLGTWSVRYNLTSNPADSNASNNAIDSAQTQITLGDLARHEGPANGTLGIGAGDGGELGVQFTIAQPLTARAIRFAVGAVDQMTTPDWGGLPLRARLRNFTAGAPDAFSGTGIATTVSAPAVFPAAEYELPFTEPVALAAGTYVMTVIEPTGVNSTLPLIMHTDRFQSGNTWVNWPTSPTAPNWNNFEFFGASFGKMPAITLVTDARMFADGFENPPAPLRQHDNGAVVRLLSPSELESGARRSSSLPHINFAKPGAR